MAEKELFRAVPGLRPAPLAMDASTRALFEQPSDFPGGAALIERMMSSASGKPSKYTPNRTPRGRQETGYV